jgi:hypothetical protein
MLEGGGTSPGGCDIRGGTNYESGARKWPYMREAGARRGYPTGEGADAAPRALKPLRAALSDRRGVRPEEALKRRPFRGQEVCLSAAAFETDLVIEPCGFLCELSNEPLAPRGLLALPYVISSPAPANTILILPDNLKQEFKVFLIHLIYEICKLFVQKHVTLA